MGEYFLNVYFILSLSVFIPIFWGIKRFKLIWQRLELKIILLYVFIDGFSLLSGISLALCKCHNIIVVNVFSAIEFLLISLFFIEIYGLRKKKTYQILVCLLTLMLSISVFNHGNVSYDNISIITKSILFIILAIIYFIKLMREQKIDNLISFPIFWVNTGILFYFSASIFIMAVSNYFFNLSIEAQKFLWLIHSVINLICYIIFAIGFYICKAKPKY